MAGRPRRRAMVAQLEARTRAALDSDMPNATHLDYVEQWLEAGRTLKDLAKELSADLPANTEDAASDDDGAIGDGISPEMIGRYLRAEYGDGVTDSRLSQARARASYVLGDQALEIADASDPDPGAVAKARLQVSTRQWLMERFNPTAFGAALAKASISVSIGELHLAALMAVSPAREVTAGLQGVATVAMTVAGSGALLAASNAEVVDNA